MTRLRVRFGIVAIALVGYASCLASDSVGHNTPSLLVVPYFTTVGDIRSSKSVLVYKMNATTGKLRLIVGSPFPSGSMPTSVAFATNRFAYVINSASDDISAYKIAASDGRLSRVPGSPFAVSYSAFGPAGVTVDLAGKFLYVVSDAGVSAFSIDAETGALAPVAGSPFATQGGDGFGTASIAVDSSGKHAYVLNNNRNTLSTYTIAANGSLTLVGHPLTAGQNSNDVGAYSRVMINPTGKYIYETSNCCVNLYAIDPTSGSLTPTAHLRLGEPGDFSLRGFAMDPTDKFAYALDRNRIYGFRIDAATGRLKGLGQAIGAGDSPETIALDPTGAFAYVVDSGSRTAAPTIYAYRIEGANGKLIPLPHSPFMVAAAMTDPIAHSFNAGECSAFSATPWSAAHPPPVARDKSESLILPHVTSVYSYDSTSRTALHYPHGDSGFTITARLTAAPPPSVSRSDLSTLRTTSGIKLGSSAAAVIRALGRPKIVNGCGQQRYVYTTDTEQSLFIQFTITNGRVTEISEDLGG